MYVYVCLTLAFRDVRNRPVTADQTFGGNFRFSGCELLSHGTRECDGCSESSVSVRFQRSFARLQCRTVYINVEFIVYLHFFFF